jgi:hypothetical protein
MVIPIVINFILPKDVWFLNLRNMVFMLYGRLNNGNSRVFTNLVSLNEINSQYSIEHDIDRDFRILIIGGFIESDFHSIVNIYYVALYYPWYSGGICFNGKIGKNITSKVALGELPGQDMYFGIKPEGGLWCGIGFHIHAPLRLVLKVQNKKMYRILYMDRECVLTIFYET